MAPAVQEAPVLAQEPPDAPGEFFLDDIVGCCECIQYEEFMGRLFEDSIPLLPHVPGNI